MTQMNYESGGTAALLPSTEQRLRLRKRRTRNDKLSRYGITTAGFAVIGALTLIFVYLFSEVFPMLRSTSLALQEVHFQAPVTQQDPAKHLVLERYEEIASTYSASGKINFFSAEDGKPLVDAQLDAPENERFSAFGAGDAAKGLMIYGLSNGQAYVIQQNYALSYPDDKRHITPSIQFPVGEGLLTIDEQGKELIAVAVQETLSGIVAVSATEDHRILLSKFSTTANLFTGELSVTTDTYELPGLPNKNAIKQLQVDKTAQNVLVIDDQNTLHYLDIRVPLESKLTDSVSLGKDKVTAFAFINGTSSFILGRDSGRLSQWFLIRDEDNIFHARHVRDFKAMPGGISSISPEYTRKGFLAADTKGHVGVYYGTSQKSLLIKPLIDQPISLLAVSPINTRIIVMNADQTLQTAALWNAHPEISFSALWNEVWYEGRDQPEYIWQASSGADDFEAKMSLIPLSVGTLKAAFFAMLFAMPLGIMGAIYTAYFLTPKLRGVVKPSIEIMEALPTVILGFLAGLWLAPYMENNLPAIFSILIGMPLVILLTAFAWSRLPRKASNLVPEGWEAVVLVLPLLIAGWVFVSISPWVEVTFFDGSMRQWFTNNGITYDQRNAMVVGVAMGFAVIPTIFSIAEDAVFNVPKHLTQGSLALGATRWQTVVGVVLPTASPGIFSAVMMGFGRAVGETMIVLMATGNSPIVNFNIFEGMRTLSANIAVELPETAVGSSHFRVLFLAALVLLALTFVVNTLAELIRQRLRARYSNL